MPANDRPIRLSAALAIALLALAFVLPPIALVLTARTARRLREAGKPRVARSYLAVTMTAAIGTVIWGAAILGGIAVLLPLTTTMLASAVGTLLFAALQTRPHTD